MPLSYNYRYSERAPSLQSHAPGSVGAKEDTWEAGEAVAETPQPLSFHTWNSLHSREVTKDEGVSFKKLV